jgi:CheY-like chemotaxis protein
MRNSVLIVEDEFLLRMEAVFFIEDAGFKTYEAGNAEQAIALLELHDDIRVVFTHIQMPGSMDGLKLSHYVRKRWPPVTLIITSGLKRPLTADMPVESAFFGKPYHLVDLAAHFRAVLN